jgi:hypothetical protein
MPLEDLSAEKIGLPFESAVQFLGWSKMSDMHASNKGIIIWDFKEYGCWLHCIEPEDEFLFHIVVAFLKSKVQP